VVATDDGDELAVAVDDRLRSALRGGRPRPSGLENEMDSALSPRDIQARIRAGESLEQLAEVAGLPPERVERFAAPVLAEREHLAGLALAAPVRRRGETSGHRNLRVTVADRLLKRGVDADALAWDAYRLEDGRWAVTADYRLDDADRHATFTFDQRGRFSVAGDDEARWLIGEEPPAAARWRDRDVADEPTVDLSDELALVRATQEADPEPAPGVAPVEEVEAPVLLTEVVHEQTETTRVRAVSVVPDSGRDEDEDEDDGTEATEATGQAEAAEGGDAAAAEPAVEEPSELSTLYAMLGSDGYSEDSPRVYAGLSDAVAVPETAAGGWEPAMEVDYPVEPGPQDEAELAPVEDPDRTPVPGEDVSTGTESPTEPSTPTDEGDRASDEEFQLESEPAPEPKHKRKRAAVPSWDEIMFGGPKPPS
jgi:hypothetical protein